MVKAITTGVTAAVSRSPVRIRRISSTGQRIAPLMAAYPVRREHVEGPIQAGARRVSTKGSSAMPSAARACH